MKNKLLIIFSILSLILVTLSFAYALSDDYRLCRVSNQIRPANQIDDMNPHFTCCNCGDEEETCHCSCNPEIICKNGDTIKKEIRLKDVSNKGAKASADISVYNYDGLDKISLSLRITRLKPGNQIYEAWLIADDEDDNLNLGEIKTNKAGRGFLSIKEKVKDFNIYEKLVVKKGNALVLSGNLDFKCSED